MDKNRITFVLPGRGINPVGGFKIVYEYANRLSALGFTITIIHVAWLNKSHPFFEGIGRYIYCLLFFKFHKKWFSLNEKVINKWVLNPISLFIPNADFIIATSWETAEFTIEYPQKKGEKLYLIQGNEAEFILAKSHNWEDRVYKTWKFQMRKIVISSWLQETLLEQGVKTIKINNGLNFEEFYVSIPPELRNPATIMMLYHSSPKKGCIDGLAAIEIVKFKHPKLEVQLFGVPPRPKFLPKYVEYFQLPNRNILRDLYNKSAIFLSPSHSEGWGLPVAEAMQCGCAVITTDIGGFKEFVTDSENGLLFQVGDINEMAQKIMFLIETPIKRIILAKNGNKSIQKFTWDKSINLFIKFLEMKIYQ